MERENQRVVSVLIEMNDFPGHKRAVKHKPGYNPLGVARTVYFFYLFFCCGRRGSRGRGLYGLFLFSMQLGEISDNPSAPNEALETD